VKSEVLPSKTPGASELNSAFVNPMLKIQRSGYSMPTRVAPRFIIKQRITPVIKKKLTTVAAAARSPCLAMRYIAQMGTEEGSSNVDTNN